MPVARLIRGGGLSSEEKFQIDLLGTKDGINATFSLPDKVLPTTFRLYRNGVRQMRNGLCDYSLAESGGVGTGYDIVILGDRPPLADELLFSDYRVAS